VRRKDELMSHVDPPLSQTGQLIPTENPTLLDAILESAMDAIIVVDALQQILLFNHAAESMFQVSRTEMIGQSLDRLLPKRFARSHQRDVDTFISTGSTSRAMGHLRPLTALRADGTEFPIEATISQITIDDQPYAAAIVRDISARHAADLALRRQLDLLNLTYDAIFTRSSDGEITFWNQGAERLYGYTAKEAIGRHSHELLRTGPPEVLRQCIETLVATGSWEGEMRHTRKDGVTIPVESRHVIAGEGQNRSTIEACRDITARKHAEVERLAVMEREAAARAESAALARQRDRLQEILDSLPAGVMIIEGPGEEIEFSNAAFNSLVSGDGQTNRTAPVDRRAFALRRADGTPLPANASPGQRALLGERIQNQQLILRNASGAEVPIAAHAAPIESASVTHPRAIVIYQDTTQLRQAEQVKDDFLALISHELRTPLTSIHGGARLLATHGDSFSPADRAEVLNDVIIESDRLDQLLGNLATLTSLLSGSLDPTTEPVLVAPVARLAISAIAVRYPRHVFPIDIERSLPPVEADPGLMEQLLRNLYENAAKYSPSAGSITTSAIVTDQSIAISVTDEGIGIAAGHLEHIFERFRRVGETSSVRGMGLGLYLSRLLAETQHGSIAASSPGLGLGSTFTVTLPISEGWLNEQRDDHDQQLDGSVE
jgi:PAS domain S-box-containing protein